jgi:hypothetical protein
MEELSLSQKVGVAIAIAPTILMFGPLPLVLMSGDFFMRQIVKHKVQDNSVKFKPR